jgi:hypothetical protein
MTTELNEKKNKSSPLDEKDISLLKRYGQGPYSDQIQSVND